MLPSYFQIYYLIDLICPLVLNKRFKLKLSNIFVTVPKIQVSIQLIFLTVL